MKKRCLDLALTCGILVISFVVSLMIDELFRTDTLIPTVFVLGVFLVSLCTEGYLYGIAASLASVLAVNFAFTNPYFKFNFTILENMFSAVIMLVITIGTSALTTKVKAQEKLRVDSEREKMRANLLRAVSHDLRTPLTTIIGSSSAILDNYDRFSEEQQMQLLRGIREDAQWLMRMVENLLSVTKIDGGGVRLIKTDTVVEELVDEVLVKFRKRYPEQEVAVTIPEEFVVVPMDGVLIEQVLTNLLENAVEHAQGMEHLTLSVELVPGGVEFAVGDDGCGIQKDRLDNLFTGYLGGSEHRGDSRRRNMGIGLSVCATIIKAHGGWIQGTNRPEGGAEFRFFLSTEE